MLLTSCFYPGWCIAWWTDGGGLALRLVCDVLYIINDGLGAVPLVSIVYALIADRSDFPCGV